MKTLGLLIIVFSVISFGLFSSYKTKRSLASMKSIINFMYYTKSQIERFNTPLDLIYRNYAENENCIIADFIEDVLVKGWSNAITNTNLYLPEETRKILIEYGEYLGKSNKITQLIHCNHYIEMIEEKYKEMEKTAPDKIKLSLTLSVYSGLMLIILFI